MESPVRSVDTSAGSAKSGTKQESSPVSSRFEAKSYLERQVEELSCADEEEAQQKVSKRLELKQERAKEKRCAFMILLPSLFFFVVASSFPWRIILVHFVSLLSRFFTDTFEVRCRDAPFIHFI